MIFRYPAGRFDSPSRSSLLDHGAPKLAIQRFGAVAQFQHRCFRQHSDSGRFNSLLSHKEKGEK
jgi:hypothetical protein